MDLINMKVMIEMVKSFNGNSDEKKIDQWRVLSHRYKHYVKSQNFLKIYRVVSEKRRIIGNDTLPFGFVDNE